MLLYTALPNTIVKIIPVLPKIKPKIDNKESFKIADKHKTTTPIAGSVSNPEKGGAKNAKIVNMLTKLAKITWPTLLASRPSQRGEENLSKNLINFIKPLKPFC